MSNIDKRAERLKKYCWIDENGANKEKATKRLAYIYVCIYENSTFDIPMESGLLTEKNDIYRTYNGDLVGKANKECDRLWKIKYPNYKG